MPQPRRYASRAQQQAAYRDRRAAALRAQVQAKNLPALPTIASMPGTARWSAAIELAHTLLATVCEEMQAYADERSEQWQQSDRAVEHADKLGDIEEVRDALDACR